MSDNNKQLTEDLGFIIRSLADAWPNDRDSVAVAGAKFEEVISNPDFKSNQLKRLTDLSWEGIKHLYQKDDFFMMVKSATMQAINIFREFVLQEGDIKVEEFERAYEDLEKALTGGSESADTVIELDDETIQKLQKEKEEAEKSKPEALKEEPVKEYSLDDLASFVMTLDESAKEEELLELAQILKGVIASVDQKIAEPLSEAATTVSSILTGTKVEGWLEIVSQKTEAATEVENQVEWDETTNEAETTVEEPEQKKAETTAKPQEAPKVEENSAEVFTIPVDIELSMVGEFITECTDLIEMAESALLDLEESPDDDELINTVFRAFHTIKGTSAFMGLDPVSEFTHSVETLLSMVREGDLKFDRACADITLESIDIINKLLAIVEHAQGGDPLPTDAQYASMLRVLTDVSDNKEAPVDALKNERGDTVVTEFTEEVTESEVVEDDASELAEEATAEQTVTPPEVETPEKAAKSEGESSVRVSVGRLDRLIDMVGELVIAHSVVAQDKAIPKDSELQKKVNHATKILRELQDTSLTLRMVPLKATFHKMNRLVRDLSRKAGKPVKFSTYGEDTEIDRNMVDIINEPLIHMLRNSLDHGIETPEERSKTDKNQTANISLRAAQEGGKVVITIEDDGRGIDKEKIFNKAVEKGLIDPDKKLSEKEIYGLIFLPGFSSAEKVTDLSGRGVGMDVVRRSIEQLQGKVEVNSELGKGTTITIELPFTLAITDGMLVRVANERFIVPTINIDMTFRAEQNDLFTVMGDSEQVNFRGKSVPVIRLHKLFDIEGGMESLLEGTLLVIKNNNSRYALLVDEVIGQQQLVGKSINMIGKTDHISGGAILGDGRVGLILDTAALVD